MEREHPVPAAASGVRDGGETAALQQLLLLEDDPTVAAFLLACLDSPRLRIEHATDLAAARALAGPAQSLWLLDVHLPDGHAGDLLAELRGRGLQTPAIALTADTNPATASRLRAMGFADVLPKPLTQASLRAALRPWLAATGWDDAAAARTLGDAAAVPTMRRLFLAELPDELRRIRAACASGDVAGVQARLHRLQASCGFVGATALLRQVRVLAAAPGDPAALAAFEAAAAELLPEP